MRLLLACSCWIDALNERVGRYASWLVLACILISAANAIARYGFNLSSNAFLEIQWYLYSIVFLCAAGYTLKHNAHVRIDIVSARLSDRARAWVDLFGGLFMLLPAATIILWFGWSAFLESYRIDEISSDAGGLLRWPIKFIVPLAFLLLILQSVSETIKRIAFLRGMASAEQTESDPRREI
ncbi:MAG: TRAP transporter small permease subunit [Betaproteobacteria bacterium]|nr:TRAP transporter small permease subunit [Betaproteobacteria bacterium]MDH3437644.1 TRAP transporter small permease subunit [Betaproteobacteria bacterium]